MIAKSPIAIARDFSLMAALLLRSLLLRTIKNPHQAASIALC
ncbi:hypothetical protein [Hydrococcus rivularis]|nr:hypothetical protein [Hydrococcus rivularis]